MARAEVEGGGFEHEAFEADDGAGGGLEDLGWEWLVMCGYGG